MGCCGSIFGCLFFLFNTLFFICGGTLLGIGIWLAVDASAQGEILGLTFASIDGAGNLWTAAVYTMIAAGAFLFVVGFFGCCGEKSENVCMLNTYVALMVVCLLGQLTFAVLAIVFDSQINDNLQDDLQKQVQTNFLDEDVTENDGSVSFSWNFVQVNWKCCGSTGYADYANSEFNTNTGLSVPWSCCVMEDDQNELNRNNVKDLAQCRSEASNSPTDIKFLHTRGCFTVLNDWTNDNAPILIGLGFGIMALQIVGIIIACCLSSGYKAKAMYV